jgi:hypothetical protein
MYLGSNCVGSVVRIIMHDSRNCFCTRNLSKPKHVECNYMKPVKEIHYGIDFIDEDNFVRDLA